MTAGHRATSGFVEPTVIGDTACTMIHSDDRRSPERC